MFIVLEGGSGGGKGTQLGFLAAALRKRGNVVEVVSMLDSTELGMAVRALKQGIIHGSLGHRPEALLYFSVIAHTVDSLVRPALERGSIVLGDRYIYSTVAYQGYGGEQNTDQMFAVGLYAVQYLEPDLVVYLDIPVEQGLSRHPKDSHVEQLAFRGRVRQGYLQMAKTGKWVVVDASQSPKEVHWVILENVLHYLE